MLRQCMLSANTATFINYLYAIATAQTLTYVTLVPIAEHTIHTSELGVMKPQPQTSIVPMWHWKDFFLLSFHHIGASGSVG